MLANHIEVNLFCSTLIRYDVPRVIAFKESLKPNPGNKSHDLKCDHYENIQDC